MLSPLKIAIVNYLNTRPFIYGLTSSLYKSDFEIIECTPAECAENYFNKSVDIALVPIGALLGQSFQFINNYGIGSNGPVSTVCLISDVPIEQVSSVFLDYQSRTSVLLVQLLFKYHWQLSPIYINTLEGYEVRISGSQAGLVIGDRAFIYKSKHKYVYDLGAEWTRMTGLPFIYAGWLSTSVLSDNQLSLFNRALQYGLDNLSKAIGLEKEMNGIDLSIYFTENIRYQFDASFLEGMEKFILLVNDAHYTNEVYHI